MVYLFIGSPTASSSRKRGCLSIDANAQGSRQNSPTPLGTRTQRGGWRAGLWACARVVETLLAPAQHQTSARHLPCSARCSLCAGRLSAPLSCVPQSCVELGWLKWRTSWRLRASAPQARRSAHRTVRSLRHSAPAPICTPNQTNHQRAALPPPTGCGFRSGREPRQLVAHLVITPNPPLPRPAPFRDAPKGVATRCDGDTS